MNRKNRNDEEIEYDHSEPEIIDPFSKRKEEAEFHPIDEASFTEAEELIIDLNDIIEAADFLNLTKEELLGNLKRVLVKYPAVTSALLRTSIVEEIVQKTKELGSISLDRVEVEALWG